MEKNIYRIYATSGSNPFLVIADSLSQVVKRWPTVHKIETVDKNIEILED